MLETDSGADIFPLWIHGVPSSYSNPPRDATWKAALAKALPLAPGMIDCQGIKVDFVLLPADWSRDGNDLDNLCDLPFSVLINAKGWVGGRRPNLRWYRVSKQPGERPGCLVDLPKGTAPPFGPTWPRRILDDVYTGELPKNARDPVLARWVEPHRLSAGTGHDFSVLLQFGGGTFNIGDIATGPVKGVLDSLYPILGGSPGKPEDWRITLLQVEKSIPSVPDEGLRICVWGD